MDSELVAIIVVPTLVIAALTGGALCLDARGCHSRWSHSGFETSWGPVQGCLISRDGKAYIPEDNYRELKDAS